MRKPSLLLSCLLTCLLLSACADDTASYFVDGPNGSHAIGIHRAQKYFWNSASSVELILTRLPDCLRRIPLTDMPAGEIEIELLSGGDRVWTLRAGKDMWQVETQTCTLYPDVKGDGGELVGVFRAEEGKLVFEAAVLAPASPPAAGAQPAAAQATQ